jgi:carboxynorspermidine decarboxylase
MPDRLPAGVSGLHFHTLCEQGLEPLIETFRSVEENFATFLTEAEWINLGGGHHITRDDYDVEGLIAFIKEIKEKWQVDVYLEPGEAIALNAGTLITRVLDIVETSDLPTLILDASAACHMPDVLEMPYTPPLFKALASRGGTESAPESCEEGVWVRLASRTCLAGDVIGIYRMPALPRIGDILTFGDMAIYSMVKNNTFNGMALPDIVLERDADAEDRFELVKRFGYEDFKGRLS